MLKKALLITAALILGLATLPGRGGVGKTSAGTNARAQILIGTSVTGGLLLNSDSATGSDFKVQ